MTQGRSIRLFLVDGSPNGLPTAEILNIRIEPEDRSLIDRAAEEAILDQAILSVTPEAYQAFLEQLDLPPKPS
jgi:uncharacterized protein (DUF1778 family)